MVPSETISVDKAYELRKIKRHWVIFDKNFNGNINDGYKFSYGILIDEFCSFLEHIKIYVRHNSSYGVLLPKF